MHSIADYAHVTPRNSQVRLAGTIPSPPASPDPGAADLTREYIACAQSPSYFLDRYCYIIDPVLGPMEFKLWDWQADLIKKWHREHRVVVLKARQLGASWMAAGYALWHAIFNKGATVLLISDKQDNAVVLLSKAEYMYDRLPQWLRPQLGKHNETTLQFKRMNSKISVLPSTEDAGRGEAASLVIVDEAAFHPYAQRNYAAYKPTVDAGGKLIVISTAKGRGSFFHSLWTDAPGNGFTPVFLSWRLRPGRDDQWLEAHKLEYSSAPHLFQEEYPDNPVDAFVTSSGCLFDIARIREMLVECRPPRETRMNGMLKLWQAPIVGRKYVLGADVAEGHDVGNGRYDYSGAAVYDWQTCVHVADLHGQWPLDKFAQLLNDLGREYGNALLGVEANNHGHAVLLVLQQLSYPSLYWHSDTSSSLVSKPKTVKKLGWPSNRKTKPLMEKGLEEMISSGSMVSWDEAFWDECLSYVRHGNGTNGAESGTHDDRVTKHMIALQMRNYTSQVSGGGMLGQRWRMKG